MEAMLIAAFAAAKPWLIRILVGYFGRFIVQQIRLRVPDLWRILPDPAKYLLSTALGAILAAATGDPSQIGGDLVGGAAGGVLAKVSHDQSKKAREATPSVNPMGPAGVD